MSRTFLIKTPFASASQTAKTLGVSKSRKNQLVKLLNHNKRAGYVAFVFSKGDVKKVKRMLGHKDKRGRFRAPDTFHVMKTSTEGMKRAIKALRLEMARPSRKRPNTNANRRRSNRSHASTKARSSSRNSSR